MFTGIIETIGIVKAKGQGRLVLIPKRALKGLAEGESIAVDGVCLTIDRFKGNQMTFRLLPETVRISTLGKLRPGSQVNVERALKASDRLGGHLLLGHVDGQGILVSRSKKGRAETLEIQVPEKLARNLVPKGPIGIDGVSLTLGEVSGTSRLREAVPDTSRGKKIRVHLIPRTARVTTLGKKPIGSRVNLEVDLIVKYLRGML